MDVLERCNAKVTVWAKTPGLSSANVPTVGFTVSQQNVPAVVWMVNGDERITYGAERETRDGKMALLPGTSISAGYRVTWNGLVGDVNSVRQVYDIDGIVEHQELDWTVVEGWPNSAQGA